MRNQVSILLLLLAAPLGYSSECRCKQVEESSYVTAECPSVKDDPGYRGEATRFWFESIEADNIFGMLGDISGRSVCLSDVVIGNVYAKYTEDRPWADIARDLAGRYRYSIKISDKYIYVFRQ